MTITPWYKQFWPWFIISIPAVTIIACIGLIIFTSDKASTMVAEDYYKKGKAINLELTKFERAQALYIHADLTINEGIVRARFTKGDALNPPLLKVNFYHATLEKKDVSLRLTPNANGEYSAITELLQDGQYIVYIEPLSGEWKLKQRIKLPSDKAFNIGPNYK